MSTETKRRILYAIGACYVVLESISQDEHPWKPVPAEMEKRYSNYSNAIDTLMAKFYELKTESEI